MAYRYVDKKRFKGQTSAVMEEGIIPPIGIPKKKKLTEAQKRKLRAHLVIYSPAHIRRMKELMMKGLTFDQAHRRTEYLP